MQINPKPTNVTPFRPIAIEAVKRALSPFFVKAAEALESVVNPAFEAGDNQTAEFASIEATRIRLFASAVLESE